jgi:hypothetical protein
MTRPLATAARIACPAALATLAALAALCGCSSAPGQPPSAAAREAPAAPLFEPLPPAGYPAALIEGVPHVRQKPDFCGEACVEMWARKIGLKATQDDVFDASGMSPARGMGATTRELQAALERLGFRPGQVWFQAEPALAAEQMEAHFRALLADLARGVPSIVCMHYDDAPGASEHFRLVLGYDPASDEIIYNEPARDGGAYRRMTRAQLLRRWPLRYRADRWTVIRLALEAGKLAPLPPRSRPAPADYAQRVMSVRERAGAGFSVVIEPPFVVVGDESARRVGEHARDTVRWAVERLRRDFFARDPDQALEIWLFSGKTSYEGNARRLFGSAPETPYGYFSPAHGALVMNISTGGGTLVHEIVHPFMAANVPGCPPWLNEGLASLYEASADDGEGHIIGRLNWRLPGLKRALKAGRTVPLGKLLALDEAGFYGDESGLNYAQARYLLYYLQQRGTLTAFFRGWLASRADDPRGERALLAAAGEPDLAALERAWGPFVTGLR